MNDKAWAKRFSKMLILIAVNILFLCFSQLTGWLEIINQSVLMGSFFLFILARIIEMKGIDVKLIMLANTIVLLLNILSFFNLFWINY